MNKLFDLILSFIDSKGLMIKKGTCVDSTQKRGKQYFGYKAHIGTDIDSKIIRKRNVTSARPHDSTQTVHLLSGDEKAVFGDSAMAIKPINKRHEKKESIMEC